MCSQEPEKKILLQSDSYCLIPNLKRERKICCRLFTSSFKRKVRKFHMVVSVKETAKKCTKRCNAGAVIVLLIKSTAFLMFSLHLKLPNLSVF